MTGHPVHDRDPARPDCLLFVEHFADQAAYKQLIAAAFSELIEEFVEIDHELVVAL